MTQSVRPHHLDKTIPDRGLTDNLCKRHSRKYTLMIALRRTSSALGLRPQLSSELRSSLLLTCLRGLGTFLAPSLFPTFATLGCIRAALDPRLPSPGSELRQTPSSSFPTFVGTASPRSFLGCPSSGSKKNGPCGMDPGPLSNIKEMVWLL